MRIFRFLQRETREGFRLIAARVLGSFCCACLYPRSPGPLLLLASAGAASLLAALAVEGLRRR